MDLFLIMQGVHRSVASREAGLPGVLAVIEIDGSVQATRVIPIVQLLSPKSTIDRWDRNRDIFPFIESLRTVEGRAKLPAIFVQPISSDRAKRFTPVNDVIITENEEMS